MSKSFLSDELLSQLSHHEVTVPSLVDHRGDFLSNDISHEHVVARTKRSTTTYDLSHQWIFYKLSAYGREFHLNLTLNTELVSKDFLVEYRGRKNVDRKHKRIRECHYIGHINSQLDSRVALSNCYGLVSSFNSYSMWFAVKGGEHSELIVGASRPLDL